MRAALIGGILLVVLVGGTVLGIASLVLLPLVGMIALLVLLVWFIRRRAEHKPPIR